MKFKKATKKSEKAKRFFTSGPNIDVNYKEHEGIKLHVYTDGSARQNGFGGPGTWAYVIVEGDKLLHEKSSLEESTTNNRMEMSAVLAALTFIDQEDIREDILIHMDSSYVYNGCTNWMYGWAAKNWKRGQGLILNADLWSEIYALAAGLKNVKYKWVKGHAENKWNNHVDALCTATYPDSITSITPILPTGNHFPNHLLNNSPITKRIKTIRNK